MNEEEMTAVSVLQPSGMFEHGQTEMEKLEGVDGHHAPLNDWIGCSSDIDSSCGTFAGKRHHVVGDDDVLRIGLGEQCPRLVEA